MLTKTYPITKDFHFTRLILKDESRLVLTTGIRNFFFAFVFLTFGVMISSILIGLSMMGSQFNLTLFMSGAAVMVIYPLIIFSIIMVYQRAEIDTLSGAIQFKSYSLRTWWNSMIDQEILRDKIQSITYQDGILFDDHKVTIKVSDHESYQICYTALLASMTSGELSRKIQAVLDLPAHVSIEPASFEQVLTSSDNNRRRELDDEILEHSLREPSEELKKKIDQRDAEDYRNEIDTQISRWGVRIAFLGIVIAFFGFSFDAFLFTSWGVISLMAGAVAIYVVHPATFIFSAANLAFIIAFFWMLPLSVDRRFSITIFPLLMAIASLRAYPRFKRMWAACEDENAELFYSKAHRKNGPTFYPKAGMILALFSFALFLVEFALSPLISGLLGQGAIFLRWLLAGSAFVCCGLAFSISITSLVAGFKPRWKGIVGLLISGIFTLTLLF